MNTDNESSHMDVKKINTDYECFSMDVRKMNTDIKMLNTDTFFISVYHIATMLYLHLSVFILACYIFLI